MSNHPFKVGVVTVSDRAYQGVYEDLGGPAVLAWLAAAVVSPMKTVSRIVPDERRQIEEVLVQLADRERCHLILTTGGTGPAKRDVTPDATVAVAERVLEGFGERMRSIGLQYVPTAILSRQVGAIRGKSLIVNLPGKPKAIKETLDDLFAAIPDCIQLIDGPIVETNPEIVVAYRPHSPNRSQP